MFNECYAMEYIDLSNFNTSNVNDMSHMFSRCHNLKVIIGIDKFNTSKVINMTAMFQDCNEIEYIDLSNFITSNVNDMTNMFNSCYNLKEIIGIGKFNTLMLLICVEFLMNVMK